MPIFWNINTDIPATEKDTIPVIFFTFPTYGTERTASIPENMAPENIGINAFFVALAFLVYWSNLLVKKMLNTIPQIIPIDITHITIPNISGVNPGSEISLRPIFTTATFAAILSYTAEPTTESLNHGKNLPKGTESANNITITGKEGKIENIALFVIVLFNTSFSIPNSFALFIAVLIKRTDCITTTRIVKAHRINTILLFATSK